MEGRGMLRPLGNSTDVAGGLFLPADPPAGLLL
ncbi:hypothetical protein Pla8534_18010 [Lignipirellula cremea]|uniref:Uncharacterized protein n=1 Tax=Lignipirellula cremea TaxID=2528010 RepID=A0A518DQ88_9BACT|nr:hypothetical protein Pla8534_18010 [Lignipirellula cremea]